MSINLMTQKWANQENITCQYYPEITSTNDVAKVEFPKLNKDFALYLADHQTQGRGRNTNNWQNLASGEVLLSTWCFKVKQSPQPITTPLIGMALFNGLKKIAPSMPLGLKPPNDLITNKGKISGLLIEVTQMGEDSFVYIGLGLNALGAPRIDVETSALQDFMKIEESQWFLFCDHLKKHFHEALRKGLEGELNTEDRQSLLIAINEQQPVDLKYSDLSSHCDLTNSEGTTSWMDL